MSGELIVCVTLLEIVLLGSVNENCGVEDEEGEAGGLKEQAKCVYGGKRIEQTVDLSSLR